MVLKKRQTVCRKRERNVSPSVVLSGYYGFDNVGDELILRVLIEALKARQVSVTVLSANPEKTRRRYGVEAISRTSLPDIVRVLRRARLFISGGGGLFQDTTGPMSALYYGGLIHVASWLRVPVCFWAQGVGPLTGSVARRITASALWRCHALTVRDEQSALLVSELSGFRPQVTADPVWLLASGGDLSQPKTHSSIPIPDNVWHIGVSLRVWPDLTRERLHTLAEALRGYAADLNRPILVHLLSFQDSEDRDILGAFMERLRAVKENDIRLSHPFDVVFHAADDVMGTMAGCDVLIGMRFHSLVLALLQGVPVYGLPYDPKVVTLLQALHLQGCPVEELETITTGALQTAFAHYPAIDLTPLRAQAQQNLHILDALLGE